MIWPRKGANGTGEGAQKGEVVDLCREWGRGVREGAKGADLGWGQGRMFESRGSGWGKGGNGALW